MMKLIVSIALCILTSTLMLKADGMPINKQGRFEGKVTVLTLEKNQIEQIAKNRRLELTAPQKDTLLKEAGKSYRIFYVYETRQGENDCTCHAENLALRFSSAHVEIPHAYVVSKPPK